MNKILMLRHMLRYNQLTPKKLFNLLRNIFAFFLQKPTWSKYPSFLVIEPTNHCNLKCPLCPTGIDNLFRPKGMMSLATYTQILDEIGEYTLVLTLWNFGEPMINPQLPKFIEEASKRNIFTRLSTNGHFITEDNIRAVLDVDELIIALDGVDQETLEKYRIGCSFTRVKRSIDLINNYPHQSKAYVEIQFLILHHNEHQIDHMKRLVDKWSGITHLKLKTSSTNIIGCPDTNTEAADYLPKQKKYVRTPISYCMSPYLILVVDWDGTIPLCCFDPQERHSLGNSKDGVVKAWCGGMINMRGMVRNKSLDICVDCTGGFPSGEV